MTTPTPTPIASAPVQPSKLSMILNAVAIVAAYFGPQFIHSAHGTALLQAGEAALIELPQITKTA